MARCAYSLRLVTSSMVYLSHFEYCGMVRHYAPRLPSAIESNTQSFRFQHKWPTQDFPKTCFLFQILSLTP